MVDPSTTKTRMKARPVVLRVQKVYASHMTQSNSHAANEVAEAIQKFIRGSRRPIVFAGAGVGVHAGLPDWNGFMEHLASIADKFDTELTTGNLIRKRANSQNFLGAAAVYLTSDEIPEGEKYKSIAAAFKTNYDASKLVALVYLPVDALVTTNYDRALHDAAARVLGTAPLPIELDDNTMSRAMHENGFFIARIHGRVEKPETIIMSSDHYSNLMNNNEYADFMRHILTHRSCLFVGFSFLDPAITHILRLIEERHGPNYPEMHAAFIKKDSNEANLLAASLRKFNIDVFHYDDHPILWEGLRIAGANLRDLERNDTSERTSWLPLDSAKRYVATVYTRMKYETELRPLRDMVIDGIILDALLEAPSNSLSEEGLCQSVRQLLSLPIEKVRMLVRRRIEVLSGRGWCIVTDKMVTLRDSHHPSEDQDLDLLVDGIIHRAETRYGIRVPANIRTTIHRSLEEVLISRGWDLGARFTAGGAADTTSPLSSVARSIDKHGLTLTSRQKTALNNSFNNLFEYPDPLESEVLARLGRAAFALQLVLDRPYATLSYDDILPDRVYLDSNYLMPAITPGHPYSEVYSEVLERLVSSAADDGITVAVMVTRGFLNEIVSHRRRAVQESEDYGLNDPNNLARRASFHSRENLNVFIGAYAKSLVTDGAIQTFEEFLQENAPYQTEEELGQFLKTKGIEVIIWTDYVEDTNVYSDILEHLSRAYEADRSSSPQYRKTDILVKHEAQQLACLCIDIDRGRRPLFVTSDFRLRRLIDNDKLGKLGSAVISNEGLIQLIDILVGLQPDASAAAKLMWSTPTLDIEQKTRDYLIDRVVVERDELMILELPEVLERTISASKNQLDEGRLDLSLTSRRAASHFSDTWLLNIENKFYANMSEVLRERHPEEYNLASVRHRQHLERSISELDRRLLSLQRQLDSCDDSREADSIHHEIVALTEEILAFKSELNNLE